MADPDPVSRLDKLRFLEAVQLRDLERTRRWIAAEEKRVAELARRRETVERVAPDWVIQGMINNRDNPLMLHEGTCFAVGHKRVKAVSRDEALDALAHGAKPCEACRPDTLLGLDP